MHIMLSKSGRISVWEIRIISGVSFMLSTMLVYWLIQLSDPEGYRLGAYFTVGCGLSAAIVGSYFGPGIFRIISENFFSGKRLALVFIILICETTIAAFSFALSAWFVGNSLPSVIGGFFGIIIGLLLFYGIWRIIQITITVGILSLGFKYIRARESRE